MQSPFRAFAIEETRDLCSSHPYWIWDTSRQCLPLIRMRIPTLSPYSLSSFAAFLLDSHANRGFRIPTLWNDTPSIPRLLHFLFVFASFILLSDWHAFISAAHYAFHTHIFIFSLSHGTVSILIYHAHVPRRDLDGHVMTIFNQTGEEERG